MNNNFKFVDTDEDDIIMTGKQIDFMESEGLDTTGMRRFNNESISRGVANTHVFQETLKTSSSPFHLLKRTFGRDCWGNEDIIGLVSKRLNSNGIRTRMEILK